LRKFRKVTSLLLAVFALAALAAVPAGAETIRFSETGRPLASGHFQGDEHGVLHCQPVAELFIGETPQGGAPGVVVINPTHSLLGAPRGGTCEEIYEVFTE